MSDTDLELLERYTRCRAEDAFSEIVRRHLDLVHSAALRQVRSPQLAEEVAQSTFIKLAGHAHRLAPDTILTAWLYQVTRREAIDVVRREARRQLREQIAVEMNAMNANAADWAQIEPLLDDAMQALDDTDRTAVLLRFFENRSLREVGNSLGTTDDTARKRVNRAIEHLREFFAKRGVTVGASGIVLVISTHAVQAAPAGLAVAISTSAGLAGPALTAITTATKAAAMTATQKFAIAGTLLAAVAVGIHGLRLPSIWRSSAVTAAPIVLTPYYDNPTSWHRPGQWEAVPHGHQIFGGVPFEADGLLMLSGQGARNDRKGYRGRVEGIAVGRRFERLHLLHTAHYQAKDETPYARLVLHYADGSDAGFQLLYGRHARDWWRSKSESFSTLSDPDSKVVWRGDGLAKTAWTRRLFKTTFENPRPTEEVTTIDLVSEGAMPNATIIAITVGPANLPAPKDDPPGLPEPDEPYGGEIKFSAVDAESGQPVANVKLKINGEERGGGFRGPDVVTDANGECLIKHPGPSTVSLSAQASGVGVTPTRIRWQTARGDKIPSEYLFRVSKPLTIGGTVLNESGQPLANAKVTFRDYAFSNSPREPREKFLIQGSSMMTRADGNWEFRSLPPKFRNFSINVSHPEFVDARFITEGTARGFENMPMEKLSNSTAVIQLRRRGPFCDEAGKPIMDNILPNVVAGAGGIQNALPWWKELSSDRRDGEHDPSAPPGAPGCYGIAWGVKGYENTVVAFETKQMLSFETGGRYVQLGVPQNFSPEDVGRIQADWLEKTYGRPVTMKVQVLK
jgi:RNA polymerase sigma factor (sigma-70 family)